MENDNIKELLTGVAEGKVSVEEALLELKKAPFIILLFMERIFLVFRFIY